MPTGVYDRYPPEVLQWLKDNASDKMTRREAYEYIRDNISENVTYDYIRHLFLREGLPSKSGRGNCPRLFTTEQAEWLVSFIPGKSSAEIAEAVNKKYGLNVTSKQIRGWKKNHKCPSGYDTKWRSGHRCAIKGKKWAEWMPLESQMKSRRTCFKEGQIPKNYRPVGTVVLRPSNGYMWIKVSDRPSKWRMLHLVEWEKHHGPKPPGYRIMFRDGDTTNCAIENLAMVKDSVLTVANTKLKLTTDPELNDTIIAAAELLHEVTKIEGERKHGKSRR